MALIINFEKRKLRSLILGGLLILAVLLAMISPFINATSLKIYTGLTTTAPTIDGIISPGEWNDAQLQEFFFMPKSAHPADDITVLTMTNGTHLFLAYDVQPDNTTEPNDSGFLFIDLNRNGTKDVEFLCERGGYRAGSQIYNGLSYYTISGFNWQAAFGFGISPQETSRNHTTIEWLIPINPLLNYTGQHIASADALPVGIVPMGIVFAGYGTLDPTWYYGNTTNDFAKTTYNSTFYAEFYLSPPSNGSGIPGFGLTVTLMEVLVVMGIIFWIKRRIDL